MSYKYHQPLDPSCPEVQRQLEMMDDPITEMSGCGEEIFESFEQQHRVKCTRCREYGVENIEVI